MPMQKLLFLCEDFSHPQIQYLITHFGLHPCSTLPEECDNYLGWENEALHLYYGKNVITVDFTRGATRHRLQQGGGLGQAIAKAVGIRGNIHPKVLDVTAGLGQDAFVLASLGSNITMLERTTLAASLLADGLMRAKNDEKINQIIERMTLIHIDGHTYLDNAPRNYFDVIYLDPMFPEENKSALPKKSMQAFHTLIGQDNDSDALLSKARRIAKKRIVVKRSSRAPWLDQEKPHYSLSGKSTRFDIYLPHHDSP